MALVNLRYAVVDIASGETEEHELPEEFLSRAMFDHVESVLRGRTNAFAIGAGLATGSFLPAACGGFVIVSGDAPAVDRTCFLTGGVGPELKFTGFDFIVVENAASEPGYVWVRDGIAEFVPSPGLVGKHSWDRTDAVRADQGDRRIQVLSVGPWGDAGSPCSQLVTNYWAGGDRRGFAAEFGKRSLLAIAFRGMGEIELEDPEGHFEASNAIRTKHKAALGRSEGLASFCDAVRGQDFADLRHRDVACFGCPYPCRTFYKVAEDPRTMRLEDKEPGYLAFDSVSVEQMVADSMSARDTVSSLMACARAGADPLSVLESVKAAGSEVGVESVMSALSGPVTQAPVGPVLQDGITGSFDDNDALALCLSLGLCPRYWAKAGLDRDAISESLEKAAGVAIDI